MSSRAISLVGFFVLMTVGLVGCHQDTSVTLDAGLKPGDSFPLLAGKDLHGEPITLEDFRGKVILLNFFGHW